MPMEAGVEQGPCPGCDASPLVLVAIQARLEPDLLVVDDRDFPECCVAALLAFPPERAIVIRAPWSWGIEPDDYRQRLNALSPRLTVSIDVAARPACLHSTPCCDRLISGANALCSATRMVGWVTVTAINGKSGPRRLTLSSPGRSRT